MVLFSTFFCRSRNFQDFELKKKVSHFWCSMHLILSKTEKKKSICCFWRHSKKTIYFENGEKTLFWWIFNLISQKSCFGRQFFLFFLFLCFEQLKNRLTIFFQSFFMKILAPADQFKEKKNQKFSQTVGWYFFFRFWIFFFPFRSRISYRFLHRWIIYIESCFFVFLEGKKKSPIFYKFFGKQTN